MRIKRGVAAASALLTLGLVAGHGLSAQAPMAMQDAKAPPPGPGLDLINQRCSACHSAATVFAQRKSPDDWASTVQLMVDRGADLKPEEIDAVTDYLVKNFSDAPAAQPATAPAPAPAP